jgi:hypothetical protein
MNLPHFETIRKSPYRSTYYTFSKALKDFDKSVATDSEYYFTKMVALNLPKWAAPTNPPELSIFYNFFLSTDGGQIEYCGDTAALSQDLISIVADNEADYGGNPSIDPHLSTALIFPNVVIPKLFQYYTENIIRQTNVATTDTEKEYVAEIAFWKTLNLLGLSYPQIQGDPSDSDNQSIVKYVNHVSTSNFINISNNHGWVELIASIPNNCPYLIHPKWKNLPNFQTTISTDLNTDAGIYDTSAKEFLIQSPKVLDFADIQTWDWDRSTTTKQFDFNTLLLFYKDDTKIEKLHGVDFIFPYINDTNTSILHQNLSHNTNQIQTFGYSFKFFMKSNNNQATVTEVYNAHENEFYDCFDEVMGNFNSFLELQKREGKIF